MIDPDKIVDDGYALISKALESANARIKELEKINTNPRLILALNVINTSQQKVWDLHHKVKTYDEELGMALWVESLQIESALGQLNELLLGGTGYYENR